MRNGFTLLELVLTILLLVGGVASATFIFSRGIFATSDSQILDQAVALTQEKMETLRGSTYASMASEPKAALSGWPGFSREVTVTQPQTNLKQVVVAVYWNTIDGELSTSLATYVTDVVNN